ncbi:uncharacterized protein METZ01_LOCUS197905 [marine metagenome]|uniref:Uncharacterized protein n=1 Tax=marine metagenome TaxID=408172 RepID=A0A382E4X6_9ZZZZ
MGLHDLWFPGRSKKDRRNAAGKEPGCLCQHPGRDALPLSLERSNAGGSGNRIDCQNTA